MNNKRTGQHFQLQDGRRLGYAEYGPAGGTPLFYFHGFPSSRLDWGLIHDEGPLTTLNVRVIAPDRPGIGLSDPQRGRKMVDWPEDVVALADGLEIDRFAVLGVSGGGPYAAACAHRIRDRLVKTGIVCGMGPSAAPGMKEGLSWTIPGSPAIIRRVMLMLTSLGLERDPEQFLSRSKTAMSALDRQLLDQPALAAMFMAGIQEAFRQGSSGANQEAALYTFPWGFKLQGISGEVYLWHGEQDLNVPVSVGHYVADAIPNCHAFFHKLEGHLTLPHNQIGEILSKLVA
jgi:pimeloyl-ACP methyl ester carboxylesterase